MNNPIRHYLKETYGYDQISDVLVNYTKKDPVDLIDQYADLVWDLISKHYNHKNGEAFLPRMKLRDLGRIGSRGKQKFLHEVIEKDFPSYDILQRGFNVPGKTKFTRISVKQVKTQVQQTPIAQAVQAHMANQYPGMIEYHRQQDPSLVQDLPVDVRNLKNYINDCYKRLSVPNKNAAYRNKINRNLQTAKHIAQVAEHYNGVMPHAVIYKDQGRLFYRGTNLQNSSSEVREAALTGYTEVDIENCQLAIKLYLAHEYFKQKATEPDLHPDDLAEYSRLSKNPFDQLTYTVGYMKSKNIIRKQLSRLLFGDENPDHIKKVKEILNAVGFGGDARSVSYQDANGNWHTTSVTDILNPNNNPSLYQTVSDQIKLLKKDEFYSNFVKENKILNQIITKGYSEAFLDSKQLQRNKSSQVSIIFQIIERAVIDRMIDHLNKKGYTEVLRVHDALYINNCPHSMIDDLQYLVANVFLPTTNISSKKINNKYSADYAVEETRIHNHNRIIEQEELMARNYHSSMVETSGIVELNNELNKREMLDTMNKFINRQERMITEGVLQEEDDE